MYTSIVSPKKTRKAFLGFLISVISVMAVEEGLSIIHLPEDKCAVTSTCGTDSERPCVTKPCTPGLGGSLWCLARGCAGCTSWGHCGGSGY